MSADDPEIHVDEAFRLMESAPDLRRAAQSALELFHSGDSAGAADALARLETASPPVLLDRLTRLLDTLEAVRRPS